MKEKQEAAGGGEEAPDATDASNSQKPETIPEDGLPKQAGTSNDEEPEKQLDDGTPKPGFGTLMVGA